MKKVKTRKPPKRSKPASKANTDQTTTGTLTPTEQLSLIPDLSPDDPIYKTGLRIGGWYTKPSSREQEPASSPSPENSTKKASDSSLRNKTASRPGSRLPHQYPWIDFSTEDEA